MQVASVIGALANSLLVHTSPHARVGAVAILQASAYLLLAISASLHYTSGFAVAVMGFGLIGFTQSMGETCNQSMLKGCDSRLLGGWGAGTGIAGIVGPGLVLGAKMCGITTAAMFIGLVMCAPLYWAVFSLLHTSGQAEPEVQHLLGNVEQRAGDTEQQQGSGLCSKSSRVLSYTGFVTVNLMLVYTLEYSVYPGLVDVDTRHSSVSNPSWLQENAYMLAWMCYNIGVTAARTSISFCQTRHVWIFTVLQLVNVVGWLVEAKIHWLMDGSIGCAVMLLWMVWVGCMGGASYANCCFIINYSSGIPDSLREVGMSLLFCLVNVGILLATLTSTILANEVYKD